jgi:O-antigen/teichoic acid export membrane protein
VPDTKPSDRSERLGEAQAGDLTGRTVSGLRWSYLSSGINAVFQLAFTAVLARLLDPGAFGLMAMAMVILSFGQYFSQLGVGRALVQRDEISDTDVRAAFTSSVLLGAGFTALFLLAAPLATLLFPDPEVVPILRVLSLSFLLTALSITALALLQRHLRYRAVALTETTAYVIGYGPVGIVLAVMGYGPWSLVAAALAQTAVTALLSNIVCRYAKRPSLDGASLRRLYSFGSRVSVISVFEFLALNLTPIWIGSRLGAAALGVFNRAYTLINVPAYYFTASLSRVMFSAMSRVQGETARLRRAYLPMTTVFAALVIPTCWGAAGASRQIVLVVLGPQWTEAIPVFAVLAAAAPFTFLATLSGVMSEVSATLNPKAALTFSRLAILACLLWALSGRGVTACAVAFGVAELLGYIAYFPIMKKVLDAGYGDLARAQLPGYGAGVVMLALLGGVGWLGTTAGVPIAATFAAQLLLGLLGLTWFTLRGFSGTTWAAICSSLRWPERVRRSTRSGRLILWLDSIAAIPKANPS